MSRTWIVLVAAALVTALLTGTQVVAAGSEGGTQRWNASYLEGQPAYSMDVVTSADGSTVFVTGTTRWYPRGRMTTLAYDADTGRREWVSLVGPEDGATGMGVALAASPDGATVYVTGNVCVGCPEFHSGPWTTIAYDAATGERRWTRKLDLDVYPRDMLTTPDGALVLVQSGNGEDAEVTALSAETGALKWSVSSTDYNDMQDGMVVSPDSSTLYLAATDQPAWVPCGSVGTFRTKAYNISDGSLRWSTADLPQDDQVCGAPHTVALSSDGATLVVNGLLHDGQGPFPGVVVAYDAASGARRWTTAVDDMQMNTGDIRSRVAISPDDRSVFVTGFDYRSFSLAPLVTNAVDLATGRRVWTSRYDAGGRGTAVGVIPSVDGSTVFVTGNMGLACNLCPSEERDDVPLLAYDAASGAQRWVEHHPGAVVSSMAAAPDSSKIFLAGTFTSATTTARAGTRARSDACNNYCGIATSATNTRAGAARIEESAPTTTVAGWRTVFRRDAVAGAYRKSDRPGNTVSVVTPVVTSVEWVTRRGPSMGRARVFIDGKDRGVIDLYQAAPSGHTVTFDGLPKKSHRVKIRVLGRSAAAAAGSWVAIDAFRVTSGLRVLDDSSRRLRYRGWDSVRRTAASGGMVRRSTDPQSGMTLTFKGRTVRWLTATGPGFGKARIVVDGMARTVDLYRARVHWRVPVSFTRLGPGEHRITVRPLGRKNARSTSKVILSDAFLVRP